MNTAETQTIPPAMQNHAVQNMNRNQINLDEVLQVAVNVAKEAGKLVLEGFYATKTVDVKAVPYDLVTEYDKGSEKIILTALSKAFPTHKFIGEESTAEKNETPELTNDPTWIIDPIDGTTNYVHGYHESAISIAFALNKEIMIGVVYNPMLGQLFTACKGAGAFQNGRRIQTSTRTEMAHSLVAMEISFARYPEKHNVIMQRMKGVVSVAQGVRATGSAALTLAYVANGSIDAYQIDGLQCWDMAAGILLIKEAGGITISSTGGSYALMSQKMLVAATKELANEYYTVIKNADENTSS